jgi:hypothetical protein
MVGRPRAASVPLEAAKLDEESGPRDRYRSTRLEYESFWMMAHMTTACLVCLGAVQGGCNLEDLHRGHGRRRARPLCCRRRASPVPATGPGEVVGKTAMRHYMLWTARTTGLIMTSSTDLGSRQTRSSVFARRSWLTATAS